MPALSATADGRAEAPRDDRAVALWLFACCAMIFVMVVLGGVTRLTHSGLSIVEWKPLLGWIPPMSGGAWQELFQKYQATPEYQQLNHGMTLAGFKAIYWMEYTHRLWGRLIGVVFLVPLLVFIVQRRIDRRLRAKLAAIFVLGGLQGAMGWYMVKSGLVERPDVSQYRLAAHLGFAFVIYAFIFWLALDLAYGGRHDPAPPHAARLRRHAAGLLGLIFATVLAGAIVAGTDAGFAYNTFPLMGGRIVPEGMFELSPWYLNFFENIAAVQFDHRVLAITTFALIMLFWAEARKTSGSARVAVNHLGAFALLQVALGISTLLLVVPIPLAAAHQAGALLLFTSALWTAHRLARAR